MKIMKLVEERKEYLFYDVGTFWLVGNSVKDILKGDFNIIGELHLVDYEGKIIDTTLNRNSLTHKRLWRDGDYKNQANKLTSINTEDYTYFPRGRLIIYEGEYWLFLPNELFNNGRVLSKIKSFYAIDERLELNIEYNNESDEDKKNQAAHYGFKLG